MISLGDLPLYAIPAKIIFFIFGAFLVAGIVKGLIGLGLPAMALGIMILQLQLRDSMAILVIPLLVTNLWQGISGGYFIAILKRLWMLFTAGVVGIWFAVGIMTVTNPDILSVILGVVLSSYATFSILTPQFKSSPKFEKFFLPLAGAITGTIAGLTGSMAFPAVAYIQRLGLTRATFIQAIGIWFCLGSIALGGSMESRGILPSNLALISLAAVTPAVIGMSIGRRLQKRLSEPTFNKIFFTALILLGIYITCRGLNKTLLG